MINLILVCAALNIYPTVCVEWIAQPNVSYTMYFSEDLIDWDVVPAYDRYVSDSIETNRMWRGQNEAKGFFRLEVGGEFVCNTCNSLGLLAHDPTLVKSDLPDYTPKYNPPFVFSDPSTNDSGIISRQLIGGVEDEEYANSPIGHAFVMVL